MLFGVPSAKASNRAIAATVFVLFSATACYLAVEVWEGFPFFEVTSVILIIHALTALATTGANTLYLFRYMLVWILIFTAAVVFAIYRGEVLLNWFGTQFQTAANTRILVLAGIFSLCGSLLGWHIALKKFRLATPSPFHLEANRRKRLLRAGILLSFGFAMLYVWKSGGFVGGDVAYAQTEEGFSLAFGVFNLFHFTGIALLLLAGIVNDRIQRKYIYLAILSLIPGMMAGSRADFLPQAFIVFSLVANPKIVNILLTKNHRSLLKHFVSGFVMLVLGYFIASSIALWRSGGVDLFAVVQILISRDKGLLIQEIGDVRVLFLETGNMMLGGLYSAIVQVREGYTGLLFGESYFNYFLIAPPAFFGLPRPLGLEWATDINGEIMTQGGIFEVAEAYWNFGLVGCFLVSFALSYFFAWLLRRGVLYNNYFYMVWYFVFGIHGFRSIWYQNFGYFRLMTVMLVIMGLSYLFFRWFSVDRVRDRNVSISTQVFS